MTLIKPNPQTDFYVHRPIAATIAIVIRAGSVLLVRRANPPDVGRWGLPGGKIEIGESIQDAADRELLEETGIRAEARQTFTAVDAFDRDDALEARWFRPEELDDESLASASMLRRSPGKRRDLGRVEA